MYNAEEPFWGKTLRIIREIWPLGEPEELKTKLQPDLSQSSIAVVRKSIDEWLEGKGGEVSARGKAAELGRAYLSLTSIGRRKFLELLAEEYGVDNEKIDAVIAQRGSCEDREELDRVNNLLRALLQPPRMKLLSQFNELQDGVKFLVNLRAELLGLRKENHTLKSFDEDVQGLLASWFDVGFLDLRRITWDTPASILEKLIQYESVHEISSWDDLKNRLRPDRRCYAFFHPRMVDEPLIFVEVALVEGLAGSIDTLLQLDNPLIDPEKADTAIFYSISNCQRGLAGVSFGNFLIKRVVADLAAKLPNLNQFSTLSPIPGFMQWLEQQIREESLPEQNSEIWLSILNEENPIQYICSLVEETDRADDGKRTEELAKILIKLCARYLVEAKRGDRARDRVAHFHLSNGARIERLNWLGNTGISGIEQSATIMVNYLYDLDQIERNHEQYRGKGEIGVSSSVARLLS